MSDIHRATFIGEAGSFFRGLSTRLSSRDTVRQP